MALLTAVVLAMGLGVACLPAGWPGGPARPKDVLKLRLGVASSPAPLLPNSVLWVSKEFYEREGLDVEVVEVQGTPSVITAMRTGDLDIGNISTEEVVKLTASKTLELRALHSPDDRQYFMIAGRENINSVADLKGKNFAVARLGSLDHSLTMRVLDTKGLGAGDLNLVAIGAPAQRAQALAGGRVDATTVSIGTWVTIQREPGVKMVLGHEEYHNAVPLVQKVNAVTEKVLKEKPEQLRRFTAAILKASRHFAENKQAWVDTMAARRAEVKATDIGELWDEFKTAWAVNGSMNLKRYEETAAFHYQGEEFKDVPKIPVQEWADTQFVDAVLKEIGVYAKFDDPGRTIR